MRKRGLAEIFKLASANKEILFIGSDLGEGTIDEYQSVLPKQYFMEALLAFKKQALVSMLR